MSEHEVVTDRHLVAPLTDEEQKAIRLSALESDLNLKQWVRRAIIEKLGRGGSDEWYHYKKLYKEDS